MASKFPVPKSYAITKSEEEWKAELSAGDYHVIRKKVSAGRTHVLSHRDGTIVWRGRVPALYCRHDVYSHRFKAGLCLFTALTHKNIDLTAGCWIAFSRFS